MLFCQLNYIQCHFNLATGGNVTSSVGKNLHVDFKSKSFAVLLNFFSYFLSNTAFYFHKPTVRKAVKSVLSKTDSQKSQNHKNVSSSYIKKG